MPERLKGADSKSVVPLAGPGVRIPLSPPDHLLMVAVGIRNRVQIGRIFKDLISLLQTDSKEGPL